MDIGRRETRRLGRLRGFVRDQRGVTALTFAISAMVLLAAVFAAIDAERFSAARSRLQDALDAAAIAAAVANTTDPDVINQVGGKFLDAQLRGDESLIGIKATFAPGDSKIVASATADVDPIFMDLFTHQNVHLATRSEVARGQDQTLELVLVLDTTGSMAGKKIDTLKTVAKSLITDLIIKNRAGSVKIGIVPFAQYVNMGVASRNETWADVPADHGSHHFDGCYGSPPYPQNVRDSDAGRRYPGFLDISCSSQATSLTTQVGPLESTVSTINASGNTYIPAGLAWGFNMLSPQIPLTDADPYDTKGPNQKPHKVLLLMTDGANTKLMRTANGDHDGDPPWGSRAVQADTYTKELCNNIKAQKIEVYSVAFEIGSDTVARDLVKQCATDADHFYDASNSAELIAAFQAIGASLQSLHISK